MTDVREEQMRRMGEMRGRIMMMGGPAEVKKQHERGKLTVRERIDLLLDPNTFEEIDIFVKHRCTLFGMERREIPADAAVAGFGKINGRNVVVAAQDYTSAAGTFGEMHGQKFCKAIDLAYKAGVPFIQLIDSGGARLHEGQDSGEWYAQLFRRHTLYSGVIPQISLLLGPCGGGAAYGPALTDFRIMVRDISHMYMGGPAFVKTMVGEQLTEDELGGIDVHTRITSLCDIPTENENEAMTQVRDLLGFLPSNNKEKPPIVSTDDDPLRLNRGIADIIPEKKLGFDMSIIIREIIDNGEIFEIKREFARNMITCFARLNGRTVGIVANNSRYMGGAIDVKAATKHARFVRFCDAFNIPVIFIQDSPGVMIGRDEEHKGMILHGSKMLYACTEATVPKVTLIIRNSYAAAQLCMCSKPLGADFVFAWPTAEIALVGADAAASVIFAKEIAASENPSETKKRRTDEYAKAFANPYVAASRGHIDDIILPEETRRRLIRSLEILENKRDERPCRKHGLIQL